MKKLLLLLVGVFVALSANADPWINIPGDYNSWDTYDGGKEPDATTGITLHESVAIGNGYFKIRVWNNNAETCYTIGGSLSTGVWTQLKVDNASDINQNAMNIAGATDNQKFDVEFNWNTKEIRVTPETQYTVYFYDKKNISGDIYAYIWQDKDNHLVNWGTKDNKVKFTKVADKYIKEESNYYPVYKLTFTWDKTPNYLIVYDGSNKSDGSNKYNTNDLPFVNNGFYTNEGTAATGKTANDLVDKAPAHTYGIYYTNGALLGMLEGTLDDNGNGTLSYTYSIPADAPLENETPVRVHSLLNNELESVLRLDKEYDYDGSTTTISGKTLQQNGMPLMLVRDLTGDIKFEVKVENFVAKTLTVTGGAVTPKDHTYIIYFYDKLNTVDPDNLYAHIWRGEGASAEIFSPWNSEDTKTKLKFEKYVVDGKQQYIRRTPNNNTGGTEVKEYPLYKLTFTWNRVPENIQIYNGGVGGEKRYTDLCGFVDNGYYTNQATRAYTDLSPVGTGEIYIYMHFKEDLIKEGETQGQAADGSANTPAYCFVTNGDTLLDADTKGGLDDESDKRKMECISTKYQIYRYKLSDNERDNGKDVEFAFYYKDDNNQRQKKTFSTKTYADRFNPDRWKEFIYATAKEGDTNYAIQTYLSWEDFREEDANGRPVAYIMGRGGIEGLNADNWNDITKPLAYHSQPGDDNCFYIPVTVNSNSNTVFKISWIDVNKFKEKATVKHNQRSWATYDLGIIGVDDLYSYPAGSYKPTIKDGDDYGEDIRCVVFDVNTSVKYMNYNQYNWVVEGSHLTSGKTYYLVIDTHNECRTVTLADFEPNPTLEVTANEPVMRTLSKDQAMQLHRHYNHLNLASANGHIIMDRVNTADGTLKVIGSNGLDIDKSGFDINYTVTMNGTNVLDYIGKPGSIHLDYLPVSSANDVSVRAKYIDKSRSGRLGTGLTFHSRSSKGEVSINTDLANPKGIIEDATYIYDKETGVYGVVMNKINLSVSDGGDGDDIINNYAVYGDLEFTFDDDDYDISRRIQLLHKDHPIVKAYPSKNLSVLSADNIPWTPSTDENAFEAENDWSTMIIKGKMAPVYLSRYTSVTTKQDLLDSEAYRDKPLEGNFRVIYPFIYELYPTLTVAPESGAKAPMRAGETEAGTPLPADLDLSGFAITHLAKTAPVTAELKTDVIFSGVDEIAADTNDAEVEYFTVSGVRVEGDPAPGIYIRRQGTAVDKVVIR